MTGELEAAEIKEVSQSSDEIEAPRSETSDKDIMIMAGGADLSEDIASSEEDNCRGNHSPNSICSSHDNTMGSASLLGLSEDEDGRLHEELLTMLEEGQYFGAKTYDEVLKPAPVSAIAAKNLHLLVIEASAMRKLKFIHTERIKFEQFNFMSSIYLF